MDIPWLHLKLPAAGNPGWKSSRIPIRRIYVKDLKSVVQCLRDRPDMQGKEFCVVAHSWGGFQLASLLTDEAADEAGSF